MSRSYEMVIDITGFKKSQEKTIAQTAVMAAALSDHEWDAYVENCIRVTGQTSLCGGESEEEYAAKVAKAVWKANDGRFCQVCVKATYLEELPFDEYTFDRQDFKKMMVKSPRSRRGARRRVAHR